MRNAILAAVLSAMTSAAAVRIEKISYQGWPNSYRVSNGEIELVITSDIGPRIMRFGFPGGQNVLKEFKESLGKSGEPAWVARGGHRVWAAPEDAVRTYAPDNGPVHIEIHGDVIEATQPVEPLTGLQKQIIVKMAASGNRVELVHRIKNAGKKAVDLSPWTLTMMAQGGLGIHGFPPRGKHPEVLAPTNPLVMSAYTDLSDPRWKFTKKYLTLRQDPKNTQPQKLGSYNRNTFGAYLLGTDLFIKRYAAEGPVSAYPDFGCTFETFTNGDFLELETLGPLRKVQPGETAEHVERWSLHRNVRLREISDAELDRIILPLL